MPHRPSTEKLLIAMRQVVGVRIGVITLPADVSPEQGRQQDGRPLRCAGGQPDGRTRARAHADPARQIQTGNMASKQDREKRGAGRPPLARFTLTEPKIAGSMTPGQRETIIAVLADIILTALARKRRAERGLPEPPAWPCDLRREEDAGQSSGS